MSTGVKAWVYKLVLLATSLISVAFAEVSDLAMPSRLEIKSSIDVSELIVGQEVLLVIEIKSRDFFVAGTRISLPEIPNVVVVQQSPFAVNSTYTQKGNSWNVQRWELSLFPQEPAVVLVPAVQVLVSVNHPKKGVISKVLFTDPHQLRVLLPVGYTKMQQWVSTPEFKISRTLSPNGFLAKPGQSLQITVTTEAGRVLPMMLPPYQLDLMDGLAVYAEPPQLKKKNVRGDNVAIRVDRYNLVVERAGRYVIPAVEYLWWDTHLGQMNTSTLPALEVVTGKGVFEVVAHASESRWQIGSSTAFVAVVLMVIMAFILTGYLYLKAVLECKTMSRLSDRELRYCIQCFSKKGQLNQSLKYLYFWLDHFAAGVEPASQYTQPTLRNFFRATQSKQSIQLLENFLELSYSSTMLIRLEKPQTMSISKRSYWRVFWALGQRRATSAKIKLNP